MGVMKKGRPDVPGSSKSFQRALALLGEVEPSSPGVQATDSAPGFSALVNQHLMAPAPPRAIKVVEWPSSCEYFRRLLQNLGQALTLDQAER